jgi:hypothetical protein
MTYKKRNKDPNIIGAIDTVLRKADNAIIPFDDANTDYIEYKAWLEIDGNVPEAAD